MRNRLITCITFTGILSVLFSYCATAANWPLSSDLFAQGYDNEYVHEHAADIPGGTNNKPKTSTVSRNTTVSDKPTGTNVSGNMIGNTYEKYPFNEIRVSNYGSVYYQTENRGSRMDGYDEFYYVNEH